MKYNFIERTAAKMFGKKRLMLLLSPAVCVLSVALTLAVLSFLPFGGSGTPAYEGVAALPVIISDTDTPRTGAPQADSEAAAVNVSGSSFSLSSAADKAAYTPSSSVKFSSAEYNPADSGFVYFRQDAAEYASVPYGNKTIGAYGCGPTNMAMIISTLTGSYVSPITLAEKSIEWGCFVSGSGTSYAFFEKSASEYNIKYKAFTASKETVLSYLRSGKLIVCIMGPGDFTRGGHYLTLRGVTDDGMILIADSISEERTSKAWSIDYLFGQLKSLSMWAFSE